MRKEARTAAVAAAMCVAGALGAGVAANAEGHTGDPAPPGEQAGALALYDDDGRVTCGEARNHGIAPVESGHPAYEHMDNRDGDGTVCE